MTTDADKMLLASLDLDTLNHLLAYAIGTGDTEAANELNGEIMRRDPKPPQEDT